MLCLQVPAGAVAVRSHTLDPHIVLQNRLKSATGSVGPVGFVTVFSKRVVLVCLPTYA